MRPNGDSSNSGRGGPSSGVSNGTGRGRGSQTNYRYSQPHDVKAVVVPGSDAAPTAVNFPAKVGDASSEAEGVKNESRKHPEGSFKRATDAAVVGKFIKRQRVLNSKNR